MAAEGENGQDDGAAEDGAAEDGEDEEGDASSTGTPEADAASRPAATSAVGPASRPDVAASRTGATASAGAAFGQRCEFWARRASCPKLAFVPCAGARLAMAPRFGSRPGDRLGARIGSAPASGVAACEQGWLGAWRDARAWQSLAGHGLARRSRRHGRLGRPALPEPLSSSGTVGASVVSRSSRLARMATTARLASATRASSPFPAGTGAKIAASSAARPEAASGTWRETDIKILRPLQKNRLQKNRRQENRRQECKAYSPSTQVSRAFFFVYPKFEHDAVKIYVFSPHNYLAASLRSGENRGPEPDKSWEMRRAEGHRKETSVLLLTRSPWARREGNSLSRSACPFGRRSAPNKARQVIWGIAPERRSSISRPSVFARAAPG